VRLRRSALGSTFELILDGDRDSATLNDMAEEAFEEVQRLEAQLTAFRDASEVSWINRSGYPGPVPVEPGLFDLLGVAKWVHQETAGAFDVTVGPLVRCWGFHERQGHVPSDRALEEARGRVGMQHVELDGERRALRFTRPGIEINLGAIGKGYVVDRVADMLEGWGIHSALIQTGGSSVCALGAPPVEPRGWRLGVRPGGDGGERLGVVTLKDRCISTSGDFRQHFIADGRRYGHILDPRSGRPVSGVRAATCIGKSATLCDALSTAFAVMGPAGTRRYCASHDESAVLLVEADGGGTAVHEIGCSMETEDEWHEHD